MAPGGRRLAATSTWLGGRAPRRGKVPGPRADTGEVAQPHRYAEREDPAAEGRRERRGAAFMLLFGAVFGAAGLGVLLVLAPRAFREGDAGGSLAASVVGVVFTAVGAGVALLAHHVRRRALEREALRRRHPVEPWMWREDWARREIVGSGRVMRLVAWTFAGAWNALCWPLLPKILSEVRDEPGVAAFALLFPAVGLGLGVWAVRETLRHRRHGRLVFRPATLPGVIGGMLEGEVHLSHALVPEEGCELRLDCVERVRSGGDSSHERILWQEKDHVAAHRVRPGPRGSAVPVGFRIPWGETPTQTTGRQPVFWRLTLSARLPGPDLSSHFEVPVFVTADSDEALTGSGATPQEVEAAGDGRGGLPGSKVGVQMLPAGGVALRFGPARNPGVAAVVTAVAVVWTGIVLLLPHLDAPLLFPVVFGLFDLLLLFAVLDLWTGTTRVRVDGGALEIRRRILGVGWTKRAEARRVEGFEARVGMQSGRRVFYALRARLHDGRPLGCGGGIPDKREAESLAAILERALAASRGSA